MKICPKCNEKFESGKFCKFCGSALVEEEQELHCSNCGAKLDVGTKFCPNCGTKVEDSDSCWKLGRCYLYGIGTEEDDEQAFRWIQKAVDLDEENYLALDLLGDCYQNGWGTSENIGKAIECYKKAANGNNADAQNSLGLCYNNGEGLIKISKQRINISKKLLKMSHLQPWDRIFMQVIYSMVFVAKKIK